MRSGWTEERIELLKRLSAECLSAAQIADRLGRGFTRNAVIGKLHRLRIKGVSKKERVRRWRAAMGKTGRKPQPLPAPAEPTPQRLRNEEQALRAKLLKRQKVELPPQPKPEPFMPRSAVVSVNPVPFIDRRQNQCAYPISGFGAEMLVCGAPIPKEEDRPILRRNYCDAHAAICVSAAPPRLRRKAA